MNIPDVFWALLAGWFSRGMLQHLIDWMKHRAKGPAREASTKPAMRLPGAAETFTHPTTPTAADRAAKPSAHTQKENK